MIRPACVSILYLALDLALDLALGACGSSDSDSAPPPTSCGQHAGVGGLADFDVPCDPGSNGILITASGEAFARSGYAFPPASADDVAFVDGWALRYDRVLTTFDHITLSQGPNKSATDQPLCDDGKGGAIVCGTGSSVVAEVDGPFVIDLHQGGSLADADGAALDAAPVAALTGRNQQGNAAFDPATPYAFGFAVVPATLGAKNINLDAAALADYQEMVTEGYTTMLVGTATWQGNRNGDLADPGCTSVGPDYDFSALPRTIEFRLGFVAPAIYRNAQNPARKTAPIGDEEHPRGIQTVANQSTIAQLTFHLDHAFWESFVHDSPAHFDQFAARYAGQTTTPTARLEDFLGTGLRPFVDAQGHPLPWRSCLPASSYTPPSATAMSFDTLSIPVDAAGSPATSIRDFSDYARYNHSTFGHLNADGLSFVDRQYPSPP